MPTTRYTTVDGEILSENRGGTIRYYVPDPLGSTRALLDSSQTITDTWSYWPYGEVQASTGSSTTPFTFVGTLGYYASSIENVFYIRHRNYIASWSNWTAVDPLWPYEKPYAYVSGAPTSRNDFLGLSGGILDDLPIPKGILPPSPKNDYVNQCSDLCHITYLANLAKCTMQFTDCLKNILWGGVFAWYYCAREQAICKSKALHATTDPKKCGGKPLSLPGQGGDAATECGLHCCEQCCNEHDPCQVDGAGSALIDCFCIPFAEWGLPQPPPTLSMTTVIEPK